MLDGVDVIKSFGDSETEKIWKGQKSSRIPPEIHNRAFTKLLIINSAEAEDDLRIPLKFQNNEAYEVKITDYH